MIKIYVSNNSELYELDSIDKGCRLDVLVDIDGSYYKPLIYTLGRLTQEVLEAFKR